MKILYLSQFFTPEGSLMGINVARAFQELGHSVEVLTGFPNYPTGKIYPGYKLRFRQVEMMDGIKVVRVPLYPSHDRSTVRRILNYSSFSLSAATIGPFGLQNPDLVFCYNLPTLGLPISLFRLFYRSKIVVAVLDLWPESVTESGMLKSRFLNRILSWNCNRFYKKADGLTVISEGFRDNLLARGVAPEKIEVVYNWCNEKEIGEVNREKPREPGTPFTVLFAGNMSGMQRLDTVLDAAGLLKDRREIAFRFIGNGTEVERLKLRVDELRLPNVVFAPALPLNQVKYEFEKADVLLVHLMKCQLFEITIPSKIQAYFYAGKPILCGVQGNAADLVTRANAGMTFEPENPHSLAEAVVRMSVLPPTRLAEMGQNGYEYYMQHLSFNQAMEKIDALFKRVISKTNQRERV